MYDTPLFQKILVARDFSDSAASALAQAVWLARQTGGEITVAHAIPLTQDTMATFSSNPWYVASNAQEIEQRLHHSADKRLSETIAPYRASGVNFSYRTLWGTPFIELIHTVEEEDFDLVVVGTRGLSAVSRFLIGSTATRLIRKCPCPVWTVKQGAQQGLASVLAPVDFSEISRQSLQMAGELAARAGAALHVLHVLSGTHEYALDILGDETDFDARTRRRIERRETLDRMHEFVGTQISVQPTYIVERGEAWKRILAVSRRVEADLTVMGTVGRGGVTGLLIGNTAEKVLHSGHGSLLALKPAGFISPVQPRGMAAVV
ncbi:MAG TPA: universal stress protein [Pirellulales bacterium]|nr:universal stress protein [Pirellulales bacterium]